MLYEETLRLGEELLKVLQEAVTDEGLARMEQLIEARALVAQRTTELFEPGFQIELQAELKAILQQQRALDAQISKAQGDLQAESLQVNQSRTAMEGVRRALKTTPRSRWLNERV